MTYNEVTQVKQPDLKLHDRRSRSLIVARSGAVK